ncbi:hypothetical protein Peur_005679 [Populus x canadensis]
MTSIIMNSRRSRYCNGEEFGFCSGEDSTGQRYYSGRGSKNISTNYREDISSAKGIVLEGAEKVAEKEHRQKTL